MYTEMLIMYTIDLKLKKMFVSVTDIASIISDMRKSV